MTSFTRRYAARFALGSALLASACQHDSNADFDDTGLMGPGKAGSGAGAVDAGGSDAAGAGVDAGGSSSGGTKPSAGDTNQGGKASAGASGNPAAGGKGGVSGGGGKAGTDAGGTAPQAGKAGQGGTAGTATGGGGVGGTVVHPPEPMTFETIDIDDTHVASCAQNMNYGAIESMNVDGDGDCRYEILIIAPLAGIPAGALVSDATLTLTCINTGGPVTVSYVNEPWKELMVRWNTRPEVGAALGTTTCDQLGKVTINLTAAVKAWLGGEHQPYGIYLRTEDTDGTDYATSEAEPMSTRPKFSVTYTLPTK